MYRQLSIFTSVATALVIGEAQAQPSAFGGPRDTSAAVASNAHAACANASRFDACTWSDRHGDHTGLCDAMPGEPLACEPDHREESARKSPGARCSAASLGSRCGAITPCGPVDGRCRRSDEDVVCEPEDTRALKACMARKVGAAAHACADLAPGDPCKHPSQNARRRTPMPFEYRCSKTAMSASLVCMPQLRESSVVGVR